MIGELGRDAAAEEQARQFWAQEFTFGGRRLGDTLGDTSHLDDARVSPPSYGDSTPG
jgi:hypothetical protein